MQSEDRKLVLKKDIFDAVKNVGIVHGDTACLYKRFGRSTFHDPLVPWLHTC